jgi:hypothetical protein
VGKEWSVGEAEFMWSNCVGEGKPFFINRNNDHALNQVIEAAAACLYLQIFSGKRDPLVLAFTLNGALVRFFVVHGVKETSSGDDNWAIEYYHLLNGNLDLGAISDCIYFRGLTKVMRERSEEKLDEFTHLKIEHYGRGDPEVIWWLIPGGRTSTYSINEEGEGEDDGGGDDGGNRSSDRGGNSSGGRGSGGRDSHGGKRGGRGGRGDGGSGSGGIGRGSSKERGRKRSQGIEEGKGGRVVFGFGKVVGFFSRFKVSVYYQSLALFINQFAFFL